MSETINRDGLTVDIEGARVSVGRRGGWYLGYAGVWSPISNELAEMLLFRRVRQKRKPIGIENGPAQALELPRPNMSPVAPDASARRAAMRRRATLRTKRGVCLFCDEHVVAGKRFCAKHEAKMVANRKKAVDARWKKAGAR